MSQPVPAAPVDPDQAAVLVDRGDAILLDVREDDEWQAGHAPQAQHTPLGELHSSAFSPDRPIVVICRSGQRSERAAQHLAEAGLTAHNLVGGMRAWAAAGQPVVTSDGEPGQVL